jgi:hypothetical protein
VVVRLQGVVGNRDGIRVRQTFYLRRRCSYEEYVPISNWASGDRPGEQEQVGAVPPRRYSDNPG